MGVRSTGSHPTTTQADGHLLEYFRQNFGAGGGAALMDLQIPPRLTASGGVISDYTLLVELFIEHMFLHTSGTFNVTALATGY